MASTDKNSPDKLITLGAGLILTACCLGPALAEDTGFGGAEVSYSHDSNFLASPNSAPATPESYRTFSGYLGRYWPTEDLRSAFILRGEAALVRQSTYTALDSTDIGGGVGYYRAFNTRHVMTVTASGLARRFSNQSFDSNTGSLQLALKQKLSETFWLRESAGIERSDVTTTAYSYNGQTLLGSANWGPNRATLFSLSALLSSRTYDGAPGAARAGRQFGAGWVQQLGTAAYFRATVARRNDQILTGARYQSTVYSFALGFSL